MLLDELEKTGEAENTLIVANEEAAQRLVDMANERGGPDNVTVLVARVSGEGLDRPEQGEALARRAYDFEAG